MKPTPSHAHAAAPNRRPSPVGFTLVELLVVIAIIAALAALSFAVFGKANASAKRATCLNRVRNIGNMLVTSATDSGGNVQIYKGGAGGSHTTQYIPYYIIAQQNGFPLDSKRKTLYNMMKEVMFCPVAPPPKTPYYKYCYGVNLNPSQKAGAEWIDQQITDGAGNSYNLTVLNVARVQSPSSYVLIADSSRSNGQQSYVIYGSDLIAMRHKGRANACFLDGSSRSLTEGELGRLGFQRAFDCSGNGKPKSVNLSRNRNKN